MADADLVLKTKIEIFKAVIELDPQAPVFVELAESLIADGRPEEAIEICRQGLEHHPELLAGRVAMIEAHLAAGNTNEAREAFSSARKEASLARRYLGRLGGLAEDLSLTNEPAAPGTEFPVGQYQELDGTLSHGPKRLTQELLADLLGIEEDPTEKGGEPLTSPTLANLYLSQGYKESAVEVIKRLIDSDPDNPALQSRLDELGREAASASDNSKDQDRAEIDILEDLLGSSDVPDQGTEADELKIQMSLPQEPPPEEIVPEAALEEESPELETADASDYSEDQDRAEINAPEDSPDSSAVPDQDTEAVAFKIQIDLPEKPRAEEIAFEAALEEEKLKRMEMAGILTKWRDAIRERLAREQT